MVTKCNRTKKSITLARFPWGNVASGSFKSVCQTELAAVELQYFMQQKGREIESVPESGTVGLGDGARKLSFWIIVGQGPVVLSVGAGCVVLIYFSLLLSPFF